MGRRVAWTVALVAVGLAAACGGATETPQTPDTALPAAAQDALPRGGTLRVAAVDWLRLEELWTSSGEIASYVLDPQVVYYNNLFELFRCCLLRTLMSYSGTSTAEGGAEVRPDLADGMPDVSADGLTWTFRIKEGSRYAPPFEDREIVAEDFVRALERGLTPSPDTWGGPELLGTYSYFYTDVIEGAQAFADGKAGSISGLEAPDDHTLVVHLTQPAGDLGGRFSLPATAPIPPGAAEGHKRGYGRFLVASGPYMIEGSEELDFSRPPADQEPVSGYVPGTSLTFVRNPSWDAASDDLREAYPDRIEFSLGGDLEDAYRRVEGGALDLVYDVPPADERVRRYLNSAELKDRVAIFPLDGVIPVELNLAAPPFDDVHVRRAVNLVADKQALRKALETTRGGLEGYFGKFGTTVAAHIAPDSLENNLLLDYDPYATPGHAGDLERARAEMTLSKYDADGDGVCDDPACRSVVLMLWDEMGPAVGGSLKQALRGLGIATDIETVSSDDFINRERPYAMAVWPGWVKDFPSGASFFPPLFSSSGCCNYSLVGASRQQLRRRGYRPISVPSVDGRLGECQSAVGGAQFQCWAELDQYLMEQVVPWIPYAQSTGVRIVSKRVAGFTIDQAFAMPALDRFALEPEGS